MKWDSEPEKIDIGSQFSRRSYDVHKMATALREGRFNAVQAYQDLLDLSKWLNEFSSFVKGGE